MNYVHHFCLLEHISRHSQLSGHCSRYSIKSAAWQAELCKHACGMRFPSMTSHLFDPILSFSKGSGVLHNKQLCYHAAYCMCASQKPQAFYGSHLLSLRFIAF